MYGKVLGACVHGIDGQLIDVEVDVSSGLPAMNIVGLPDSAVRESIERVRSAIKNCGLRFPMERVTVNLAPADVRKEGAAFDLAIAAGIMLASEQADPVKTENTLLIGELALDGTVRPVYGVLSMVQFAKSKGIQRIMLPEANIHEALLIEGLELIPISRLTDIERASHDDHLMNIINDKSNQMNKNNSPPWDLDYADVRGQIHVKRALMIAAAGMHNIMMVGPPGTGKTMLARRLPSILPDMSRDESLEVTKIYSVAGKLPNRTSLVETRPFRSPHHSISSAGLIGGGSIPKPGEVSLSHRGVLFLDELPEFSRASLEVLRQPMEDRSVTISRARTSLSFPAYFILAASMNPCPCGYWGVDDEKHPCTCSPLKLAQYRSKLSGPLLDRIDLHIEVPRLDYAAISAKEDGLSSRVMKETVDHVHQIQLDRYARRGISFNGELSGRQLRYWCVLTSEAELLLEASFQALHMSIRSHDRVLKIARTIADLEESSKIDVPHVAEAVQYRVLDKRERL